jgi:hypothetical protein
MTSFFHLCLYLPLVFDIFFVPIGEVFGPSSDVSVFCFGDSVFLNLTSLGESFGSSSLGENLLCFADSLGFASIVKFEAYRGGIWGRGGVSLVSRENFCVVCDESAGAKIQQTVKLIVYKFKVEREQHKVDL